MKQSKRYLQEMMGMYGLPDELYTMNRGIKTRGEMRYDITLIPPLIINGQYNKTKGHIHSSGHEEHYTVLKGEAIFIFQDKKNFFKRRIKEGNSIIVPKGFYHVTINPTNKILKLANWVSNKCISDYRYLEKMKGMRYYYTTKGWVKNPNYA